MLVQVFLTAWESIMIRVVHFGFFGLVRTLPWSLSIISSRLHFSPLFVVPEHHRVRSLWVSHTIAARFELVEDATLNLTFAPQWRTRSASLRQK